jgi:hypothetical protein
MGETDMIKDNASKVFSVAEILSHLERSSDLAKQQQSYRKLFLHYWDNQLFRKKLWLGNTSSNHTRKGFLSCWDSNPFRKKS